MQLIFTISEELTSYKLGTMQLILTISTDERFGHVCFQVFRNLCPIWNYSDRRCSQDSQTQRFQPSRIFLDCLDIKHNVPKSRNTIYLSRIKAFFSTFEENPKFLLFYSPNLFVYKLTSSSTASSTIFKYFKSRRWCLLKISSSSVLLQPHPEASCL